MVEVVDCRIKAKFRALRDIRSEAKAETESVTFEWQPKITVFLLSLVCSLLGEIMMFLMAAFHIIFIAMFKSAGVTYILSMEFR